MSGIILDSYHRHLLDQPINLEEQIKFYKDYWKKSDAEQLENKKLKFKEYNVGDTIQYEYPYGYVSQEQKDDWLKDRCKSKGIVTEKDTDKFYLKIRIIETCGTKGIITYDNKNAYFFNAKMKKWEKFKKRKIKRSHKDDELWFNYESWYSND
jgi:hypothetical protein